MLSTINKIKSGRRINPKKEAIFSGKLKKLRKLRKTRKTRKNLKAQQKKWINGKMEKIKWGNGEMGKK